MLSHSFELKTQDPTLTQQEIADQVGVSQQRVAQIIQEKTVRTEKTCKPKRAKLRYEITSYTKPETAAQKIIDTFGEEFAKNLATHLSK
jgi:predicted transcriptional regulator